jgi:hypothetical protein
MFGMDLYEIYWWFGAGVALVAGRARRDHASAVGRARRGLAAVAEGLARQAEG